MYIGLTFVNSIKKKKTVNVCWNKNDKYGYYLSTTSDLITSNLHDINSVTATVNTVSDAEFIDNNASPVEPNFSLRSSIAYLSKNGTDTFNILAEANNPSANVTRFRIVTSSYIFIQFYNWCGYFNKLLINMKTNLWPNVLHHTQDHIFACNSIEFYYGQVLFNMSPTNMITCWKCCQFVWNLQLFMAITEDIVMMYTISRDSLKKNII